MYKERRVTASALETNVILGFTFLRPSRSASSFLISSLIFSIRDSLEDICAHVQGKMEQVADKGLPK